MKDPENKQSRGFTLVEIMVVVSIFSLLLFISVTNLRAPQASATSFSLAQIVAQELLRTARLRAQSRGAAVAVVIPSAAGSRPISQSIYTLEGWPNPKVATVHNYMGEFPSGYLFAGTWATSDTVKLAPANPAPFSIDKWLTPSIKDYVVCFNADGTVVTNDLPWFNDELRIVACTGVANAGGSAPIGLSVAGASKVNYYTASAFYQPQTICVSHTGIVTIVSGVKGASGVTIGAGSMQPATPPAAPPQLSGTANLAPTISGVEAYPHKNPDIPAGYTTSIGSRGYVTVVVKAVDPNGGDRLSCTMSATNSSGATVGQWSQVATQMRFDPNDINATTHPSGCWKSAWVWTPPAGYYGTPGVPFNLTCTVTDDRGASQVAAGSAEVVTLLVKDEGHVIFAGGFGGKSRLFQLTPEGTTPTMVSPADWNYDCFQPTVSPDGTKILYAADVTGGTNTSIWMLNSDGSLGPNSPKMVLAATNAPLSSPTWDPKGTSLICCEGALTGAPYLVNASISGATPRAYLAIGSQPRMSFTGDLAYVDKDGAIRLISHTTAPWATYATTAAVPLAPPFAFVAGSGAYPSFDGSGLKVFYVDSPGHNTVFEYEISTGNSWPSANFLTGIDGPLSFAPDSGHAVFGHVNNVPSYGVFVDYAPGIFLGQSTVPFGLFPYGPANGSIQYVYYPTWSPR